MNDIIKSLKTIMADSFILYIKLHNYHWHIKGSHFFTIHQLTEELYNYMATLYDDIAEIILQLGHKPLITLEQIKSHSNLAETENNEFNDQAVYISLEEDLIVIYNHFTRLKAIKELDEVSSTYADEKLQYLQKKIWMIRSSIN